MRRLPGSALLCATVLGLAACGGGGGSGGSGGSAVGGSGGGAEASSAATARREAAETRAALRAALASYRRATARAPQEQVSEAYVSHFEEVEGPLEAKDPRAQGAPRGGDRHRAADRDEGEGPRGRGRGGRAARSSPT